MKASGRSTGYIMGLWGAVTVASALAAALGYLLLGPAPEVVVATTQAFAAGAILTMLSDTMVPEAVEHAGAMVGLVTAVGFIASFLLSQA
jgi:ZIP family zinc transporter